MVVVLSFIQHLRQYTVLEMKWLLRTSGKDTDAKNENDIVILKGAQTGKGHPVPETGAVLPLALGLAITALLLLMVACRLHLVRQKLKKARPIMSEESDYLINGMYL
ncbi:UNVERIFIED_CONTAM: hypothetical protein K2H54_063045 [Gekko kuhli]